MWTAWNDCIQRPQIWDLLHDARSGDHFGRVVPAAQQGLRGRLGLHARADPQSRRLGIAVVLHEADGNVRHAARHAGPFSAAELLGPAGEHPVDRLDLRLGRLGGRTVPPQLLLYLPAASRLRRPKAGARQRGRRTGLGRARRRDRPARGRRRARPTPRGSRCGSWPANTRSCRSITSSIPTACCARRACCTSKKSRTASGSTWRTAAPGPWPTTSSRTCSCSTSPRPKWSPSCSAATRASPKCWSASSGPAMGSTTSERAT